MARALTFRRHAPAKLLFSLLAPVLGPALVLLALGAGIAPARADDPTRPPAVAVPGESAAEDSGPQLQSVFLPQGGSRKARPAALINGQRVEVGQRWGDWRLLAVTESSATLAGPEGRQTLTLTPGVAKTPHRAAPAAAPPRPTASTPTPHGTR